MPKIRILAIDDDELDAELIQSTLDFHGYSVETRHTVQSGIEAARGTHPDLVVLDIRMEEEEAGYEVIRSLREDSTTIDIPIIVFSITADDVRKRVKGVQMGAMHYLPKMMTDFSELLTMVRQVTANSARDREPLRDLPLYFDRQSGKIWIDGKKTDIKLTSRNHRDLLALLFARRGKICSRPEIALRVYGRQQENATIDRLVSRLREKLGEDPADPRFIKTVRGEGFILIDGEQE